MWRTSWWSAVLALALGCGATPDDGPPPGYGLVYGQDFEGDAWRIDFGADDPAAWGPGAVDGNGTARLSGPAEHVGPWGAPGDFLLLDGIVVGDFVAEFDVLVPAGGARELTVFLGVESRDRFVYASLVPREGARVNDVLRVDHAAPLSISRSNTYGVDLTPGVWHQVKIARNETSGRVTIVFDDVVVAIAGNGALAEGRFGFGARGGPAHFDHLRLWAPDFEMGSLATRLGRPSG